MTIAKNMPEGKDNEIKIDPPAIKTPEEETNGQQIGSDVESGEKKEPTNGKIEKVSEIKKRSFREKLWKWGFNKEDFVEIEKIDQNDGRILFNFYRTDEKGNQRQLLASEHQVKLEPLSVGDLNNAYGKYFKKNLFKNGDPKSNWIYIDADEYTQESGEITIFRGEFDREGKERRKRGKIKLKGLLKLLETHFEPKENNPVEKAEVETGYVSDLEKDENRQRVSDWGLSDKEIEDYKNQWLPGDRIVMTKTKELCRIYFEHEGTKKKILEVDERTMRSRIGAQYTHHRISNWNELDSDTQNYHEKFEEKTKEFWKKFAVHGHYKTEKGQTSFIEKGDLDGEAFLKLMQLAGMKVDDVKYLKPEGGYRKGGITGDVGREYGVFSKDSGESLVMNDEGKGASRRDSTTKIAYELLVDLRLLKGEKYLENFVEFVTKEDNKNYATKELKELFDKKTHKFARTIMGLHRYMDLDTMLEFFKQGKEYNEVLTKEELERSGKTMTLKEASEVVEKRMDQSRLAIEKMRKDGFEIESEKYGKVLVDIGNLKIDAEGEKILDKVSLGFEAYHAEGGDAMVLYIEEHKRFKIFTAGKEIDFELPYGFPVRGFFWNKPSNIEGMVPLEDILTKLCGKETKIEGKLKEAIDKENEKRKKLRANVEEANKKIDELLTDLDDAKFTEAHYSGETVLEAKTLKNSVEDLKKGDVGKGKKFENWDKKKSEAKKISEKVKEFLEKAEKEKKNSAGKNPEQKVELTERDKWLVENYYFKLIKGTLDGIPEFYSEENKYSKKSIPGLITKETNEFWDITIYEIFEEEEDADYKISEEKIPQAIEMIKNKLAG